jgi:hypothetical protein
MVFSRVFKVRRSLAFFVTLGLTMALLLTSSGWLGERAISQTAPWIFYVAPDGSDRNEGSLAHPWLTVNHAAEVLKAGDTVYVRAGTYALTQQIRVKHSGTEKQWITYQAFPGERAILDASAVRVLPPSGQPPFDHDQGALQLENVAYIQVKGLEIVNSHNSGITARNSHHVSLYNNKIQNTFSPGIGVWGSQYQKVMGNTVVNANAREMAGFPNNFSETPHEAISIGSVEHFEVAYNLVRDGQKEGIDVKETSTHGTVHHNYVHHMARQALYIDSWNGALTDVEMFHNVAHDCKGAGFVLSVEGGAIAENIWFHHNLLYDNWGSGIFFSRWGKDGLRRNVRIHNNTVYRNGDGQPNPGEAYFWLTGGLYLFSDNLQNIEIKNNLFSENTGFQIGYSDRYLARNPDIEAIFRQKKIVIDRNWIVGENATTRPIYAGWPPDNYANIYGTNGTSALVETPQFVAPEAGNFYLRHSSALAQSELTANPNQLPAAIGAFPSEATATLWWQTNFPPSLP